jgi:hypothetical protein
MQGRHKNEKDGRAVAEEKNKYGRVQIYCLQCLCRTDNTTLALTPCGKQSVFSSGTLTVVQLIRQ